MKRKQLLLAFTLLFASTAFAQTTDTSNLRIKEEGKTVFNPHWYMQVQAGAAYTRGEIKFGDMISPAAAITEVTSSPRCGDCVPASADGRQRVLGYLRSRFMITTTCKETSMPHWI